MNDSLPNSSYSFLSEEEKRFVRQCERTKVENLLTMSKYLISLKTGVYSMNGIKQFKKYDIEPAVRRTIFIEGSSVMSTGAIHKYHKSSGKMFIPDVQVLLSVMRYFAARNFDVYAVIPKEYENEDGSNFWKAIDELVANDLCISVPNSADTFRVAQGLAAQVKGLVLTAHLTKQSVLGDTRGCSDDRLKIFWSKLPKRLRNTRTKRGNDYLANKQFSFKRDDGQRMDVHEVHRRVLFGDIEKRRWQFEFCKKHQEDINLPEKLELTLALLNRLIVDGLTICPENVRKIREKCQLEDLEDEDEDEDEDEEFEEEYQEDEDSQEDEEEEEGFQYYYVSQLD